MWQFGQGCPLGDRRLRNACSAGRCLGCARLESGDANNLLPCLEGRIRGDACWFPATDWLTRFGGHLADWR